MFRKALPRALPRSARAFRATSSAAKVVATKPVNAQENKVRPHPCLSVHPHSSVSSSGRLANILS